MEIVSAVVGSVAGKLAEYAVEPIKRQFGYLIFYRRNIEDLEKKIEELGHIRTGVTLRVEEAERNLHVIDSRVVDWQKNVDETSQKVTAFLGIGVDDKCWNGWCLNPKSCYLLGRKAENMRLKVVELQEDARKFDKIAYTDSRLKMAPSFAPGIRDFQSRRLILNEVLEALKDDNISEIAICGMPGVGKTTMVTHIMKAVIEGDVFDEVANAVMSQNPDFRKIQGEIADRLGLKLVDVESESGRADKLRSRIMTSNKRILIILDDAWKKPDFGAIGLPSGGKKSGYKILYTSRNQDIWKEGEKIFIMDVLSEKEGLDLFQETAGISVDDHDFFSKAKEITKKCGGLPIAIVNVANALKGKNINIWENALCELRTSVLEGVHKAAYSCIKLSYSYLEREEIKSCLLLCCLFPEDESISINELVDYGFGLGLLKRVDSLRQARNRVITLVSDLKASFLLLDGDKSESVKMHDLVREVAIAIASGDKNGFLVRHETVMKGWPQTDRYTAVSLLYEEINEHPNDLDCPKLELLQLICQRYKSPSLPDNFFDGLKGLKVLRLKNQSILPQSLQILKNLRTLVLYGGNWEGFSIVGALGKLEILRINSSNLKMLPREFRQLTSLLLLDLRGCNHLKHIPPGVLSTMSQLEELYIPLSFKNWETVIEEDGKRIVNASIRELESRHLTVLEVCIPNALLFPVKEPFFENMETFKIIMGSASFLYWGYYQGNCLRFEGNYNDFQKCDIYVLVNKTEVLELKVNNLKNILSNKDGFPRLKALHLSTCDELNYIFDGTEPGTAFPQLEKLHLRELSNLKEIWHKHSTSSCFGNLSELHVNDCKKLKFVFTPSMAKCLCQLRRLFIKGCLEMEGVLLIRNEEDKKMINEIFSKLETLRLKSVPKLFNFCVGIHNRAVENTSSNQKDIGGCMEELTAPEMEFQVANPINIRPILFSTPCPILPNLIELNLGDCDLLEIIFLLSVANQFVQLEELRLENCKEMEGVLLIRNEDDKKMTRDEIFPKLKTLDLVELPKLLSFCIDISAKKTPLNQKDVDGCIEELSASEMELQVCDSIKMRSTFFSTTCPRLRNLKKLSFWECGLLEAVFSSSIVNQFEQLEELLLDNCKEMEEVLLIRIEEDKKMTRDEIFPKLKTLTLRYLPKLFSFCVDISNTVTEKTSLNSKDADECMEELGASEMEFKIVNSFNIRPTLFSTLCPTLPNLIKLMLTNCGLLEAVFSLSIVNQFMQLKKLELIECEKIKGVLLMRNEEDKKITRDGIFPKLNALVLSALPKLISFCIDINSIVVEKAPLHLKDFDDCMEEFQVANSIKFKHTLFSTPCLTPPNLISLNLWKCDLLEAIFSLSIVNQFVQLEELQLYDCEKMQGVLLIKNEKDEKMTRDEIFPKLKTLSLRDLPNLFSFCIDDSNKIAEKTPLNQKDVNEGMETLSESETELQVANSIKMRPMFFSTPCPRLPNLNKLWLNGCALLEVVFSPSVVNQFVQLEVLSVRNCDRMEYIVMGEEGEGGKNRGKVIAKEIIEEDEGGEHNARSEKIVFPQLRGLYILYLRNLKCFYGGRQALELPSLQDMAYTHHYMETFSNGALSTPMLKKKILQNRNDKSYLLRGVDLNATIQHLFKTRIVYKSPEIEEASSSTN